MAVVISSLASITAAVLAARSAERARAAESETARLRQLEERLSEKKVAMYEPLIIALGNMLLPGDGRAKALAAAAKVLPTFMNQVVVYGSDEVLEAYARFRVGTATEPPPYVTFNLVASLILAIRRDLAGPGSKVTGLQVIGMRVNDLYNQPELVHALSSPLDEVAKRHGWTPPWPVEE